jgi:glycosyltransferase involved in cell wall biosynthesis
VTPEITFVMPSYNAEDTLEQALACLLAVRTELPFEVVVVDDGSRDRSFAIAEAASARDPRIRAFKKANGGEASALNVGFREARATKYLAIVEADVELDPAWLERCLAVLAAEPDAIAVGGYLETPRGDPWIARLAGYEIERKFATKPREAKHLTSANVLYRREAWDLAGPFDEQLVNASLDSVFNGKLARAGKRLVYEPTARCRHHYKTTFVAYLRRQYAYARFRVHNEVLDLYPSDRWLAVHVAISGLAFALLVAGAASVAFVPEAYRIPVALAGPATLALALLLEAGAALEILRRTHDPVALAYPFVLVVRNVVGATGYAVGVLAKASGKK